MVKLSIKISLKSPEYNPVSLQGTVFGQDRDVEEVALASQVSERDAQVRRVVVPL